MMNMENLETKTNNAKAAPTACALLCVDIDGDKFNVHINTKQHTLEFEAFPVNVWEGLDGESKHRAYISKENEQDDIEKFEDGKCLKRIEGSFCWRGVWEGRIYFTDDEYWGEDIAILSKLYNDNIMPWCKEFIKNRSPGNRYDN